MKYILLIHCEIDMGSVQNGQLRSLKGFVGQPSKLDFSLSHWEVPKLGIILSSLPRLVMWHDSCPKTKLTVSNSQSSRLGNAWCSTLFHIIYWLRLYQKESVHLWPKIKLKKGIIYFRHSQIGFGLNISRSFKGWLRTLMLWSQINAQ